MSKAKLFIIQSAIVDATNTATIRVAPAAEDWQIDYTNVLCSTRVLEARCRIYTPQIGDLYAVDGTYSGSSGDTSDTQHILYDGTPMFIQWTGADIGSTVTVTLNGWKTVGDGGFRAIR